MESSKKRARRDTESDPAESEGDDQDQAEDVNGEGGEEEEDDEFDANAFIEEERSKLSALLEVFSDDELKRFEAARRCALDAKEVQRLMNLVLGKDAKGAAAQLREELGAEAPVADEKTAVLMAGLTKLYLAELIEKACVVSAERGGDLCIQPRHLREAYRRMKHEGRVPESMDGLI